jgi:hypothetical protein
MSTQYRNKWSEKKGNILPSLLPEAARALQKQIAAKWNSERTDKDYENDVFYSPSDVDYASIEDVVKHSGAKTYAKNAAKYRASKAIKMAEFTKRLTLICPQTGIVSAVDVPAIPGFFLPYENPLSSLSNSRAIAQRGYSYLLSLDTQVLAGILLVIADDYNLFQYPVFANGTSKNALLRSAGKNELIKAILFIEEKIHSENYSILPRLSLIPADDSVQGTMEVRLHNWLSIIQKELEAPTVVFPSALKVQTGLQKAREERNIEAAAEKNARKALLSFNKSLEEAIKNCKTLYKDGLIDQKLRNLLISFLDKDIFATLDGPVKAKVCLKLSTFPIESRITDLIKVFQRETITTDSVDALLDGPTVPPVIVPKKTTFKLQNSPEVIRQQNEALRAKRLADQHIRDIENLINRLLNVGQTNGQLLLTMDKSKTTGYDSILLNGEPIPEGRFQLASIKEAFAKVKAYKEAPKPAETAAYIGHPEQQTPSFGTDTAMTEIEAGIMVPTLLWNSLSDFQKRIHRRKLLLAQSK